MQNPKTLRFIGCFSSRLHAWFNQSIYSHWYHARSGGDCCNHWRLLPVAAEVLLLALLFSLWKKQQQQQQQQQRVEEASW